MITRNRLLETATYILAVSFIISVPLHGNNENSSSLQTNSDSIKSLELVENILDFIHKDRISAKDYYFDLVRGLEENKIIDIHTDPYFVSLQFFAQVALKKISEQINNNKRLKLSSEFTEKADQLIGILNKKKIIKDTSFPKIFDYSFSDQMVVVNDQVYKAFKKHFRKNPISDNTFDFNNLFINDQLETLMLYELIDGVLLRELARVGILISLHVDHKWDELLNWSRSYEVNDNGNKKIIYNMIMGNDSPCNNQFISNESFKQINRAMMKYLDKSCQDEFQSLSKEVIIFNYLKSLENIKQYIYSIETIADALVHRRSWAPYLTAPYNFVENPEISNRPYSLRDQVIVWAVSFDFDLVLTVNFIRDYAFADYALDTKIWSDSIMGMRAINDVFSCDLERNGRLDYAKYSESMNNNVIKPLLVRLKTYNINGTDDAVIQFIENRNQHSNKIKEYIMSL